MGTATSLPENPTEDDIINAVRKEVSTLKSNTGSVSKKMIINLLKSGSTTAHARLKRKQSLSVREIKQTLEENGLLQDDIRVEEIWQKLHDLEGPLSKEEFEAEKKKNSLISRALENDLVIPDFPKFCAGIDEIYEETKADMSGKNADYIPQLSEKFVNPNQYGISICTIDGQRKNIGDTEQRFCVQSCSKAITYCIAQSLLSVEKVHDHVGKEPSGRPFNEICLDERAHKADIDSGVENPRPCIPHNPMINAGAIMSCSLVKPEWPLSDRFDYITKIWHQLAGVTEKTPAGQKPTFANSTYLSEAATADRNFCLAYMMQEEGAFPKNCDLNATLQLYFMCCSIECSSAMMSVIAASLANGGVCPLTGVRVFEPEVVRNTLSLMASCGMYDYSGQFAFEMGFPAKSGVGGAVLIVIPGVMGICTFSPRLDDNGNSVRGVRFCSALAQRYPFHAYDGLTDHGKEDPRNNPHKIVKSEQNLVALLWAAAENNLVRAQQLLARGTYVSAADYDLRTPLHLAASEGNHEMVGYLMNCGAEPGAKDRYGATPVDDARKGHPKCAEYLEQLIANRSTIARKDDSHDLKVWRALRRAGEAKLTKQDCIRAVAATLLRPDDRRLSEVFANLPEDVSPGALQKACDDCDLFRRAITGVLKVEDFQSFARAVQDVYQVVQKNTGGDVATYIPELAKANPNSWGVAVCTVDGQRFETGETKTPFCVQSCSKAITYCIAHSEKGGSTVSKHVGNEPSGRPFNAMILDRRFKPAKPHNPLINAGAIMSCSLVQGRLGDSEDRIKYVMKKWEKMNGGFKTVYDGPTYSSESSTADRNRCLAYMMSEAKAFPSEIKTGKDLMENLEFYFKCCSIMQDAESMSVVAGTLANGGVCPITGEHIFEAGTVRDCLSLMYSCGMYDYSGKFAFHIGFPSKSGVAGALLIVIPNVMGICTWSPPLDGNGNSVRGIDFCRQLIEHYSFHTYDRLPGLKSKKDPTFYKGSNEEKNLGVLIDAAAAGDLRQIELSYNMFGAALLNKGDYDGRTALHLAAVEGQVGVINFFVSHPDLELQPVDRWSRTPKQEAEGMKHDEAFQVLRDAIALRRARK